jgi:hypothetical protein
LVRRWWGGVSVVEGDAGDVCKIGENRLICWLSSRWIRLLGGWTGRHGAGPKFVYSTLIKYVFPSLRSTLSHLNGQPCKLLIPFNLTLIAELMYQINHKQRHFGQTSIFPALQSPQK